MAMATATKTVAPELVGTWDIDPAHSTVEGLEVLPCAEAGLLACWIGAPSWEAHSWTPGRALRA